MGRSAWALVLLLACAPSEPVSGLGDDLRFVGVVEVLAGESSGVLAPRELLSASAVQDGAWLIGYRDLPFTIEEVAELRPPQGCEPALSAPDDQIALGAEPPPLTPMTSEDMVNCLDDHLAGLELAASLPCERTVCRARPISVEPGRRCRQSLDLDGCRRGLVVDAWVDPTSAKVCLTRGPADLSCSGDGVAPHPGHLAGAACVAEGGAECRLDLCAVGRAGGELEVFDFPSDTAVVEPPPEDNARYYYASWARSRYPDLAVVGAQVAVARTRRPSFAEAGPMRAPCPPGEVSELLTLSGDLRTIAHTTTVAGCLMRLHAPDLTRPEVLGVTLETKVEGDPGAERDVHTLRVHRFHLGGRVLASQKIVTYRSNQWDEDDATCVLGLTIPVELTANEERARLLVNPGCRSWSRADRRSDERCEMYDIEPATLRVTKAQSSSDLRRCVGYAKGLEGRRFVLDGDGKQIHEATPAGLVNVAVGEGVLSEERRVQLAYVPPAWIVSTVGRSPNPIHVHEQRRGSDPLAWVGASPFSPDPARGFAIVPDPRRVSRALVGLTVEPSRGEIGPALLGQLEIDRDAEGRPVAWLSCRYHELGHGLVSRLRTPSTQQVVALLPFQPRVVRLTLEPD